MKSIGTMYRLARSHAVAFGARVWKGMRAGVFLTVGELKRIYDGEGFNRKGSCMRRHLGIWMSEDLAVVEGSMRDPEAAVWFDCPDDLLTPAMALSERSCGGRCVTRIDRLDWPVLRQIHGIQAELGARA